MIDFLIIATLIATWTIGQLEFISFWKSRRNARKTIKLSSVSLLTGFLVFLSNYSTDVKSFSLYMFEYYGITIMIISGLFIFGSLISLLMLSSQKQGHFHHLSPAKNS